MFSNIGGKIKVLSIVTMVVGMIFSMTYGIVLLIADNISVGILLVIGGPLLSWASVFVLYGLGELIESSAETADNTRKLLQLSAISGLAPQKTDDKPARKSSAAAAAPDAKAAPDDLAAPESAGKPAPAPEHADADAEPAATAPAENAPEPEREDVLPPYLKVLQDEILTDVVAGALSDKAGEDIDPVNIPDATECPACFHTISPDDDYCEYCGQKLK